MTKDEAMKLALEILEYAGPSWIDARQPAITAIKEALAQPDPVKIDHKHEWFRTGEMKVGQMRCISCGAWGQEETPQPEQEPVAWYVERQHVGFRDHGMKLGPFWKRADAEEWVDDKQILKPLYTTPPQRKPLTDEETYKIQTSVGYSGGFSRFVGIVRAIEAAHGIKGEA